MGIDACVDDRVAKLPPSTHEARRRSDDHEDGVAVASRRVDAIFMILKFGTGRKRTLRPRRFNLRHAARREDRCEVERLDEGDVVGADDFRVF